MNPSRGNLEIYAGKMAFDVFEVSNQYTYAYNFIHLMYKKVSRKRIFMKSQLFLSISITEYNNKG